MLVTGSEDATARLWATRTEETECLGVLKYPPQRTLATYFDQIPITNLLAFALQIQWPPYFRGHSSYINCVAMHDTFVITGGADSTIRK